MNSKKAYILACTAGIFFVQGYARAAEQRRPNIFKAAVVGALAIVGGKVIKDPNPTAALQHVSRPFCQGLIMCSTVTGGMFVGMNMTPHNPARGAHVGGLAGLTVGLAGVDFGRSSIRDIPVFAAGCACGAAYVHAIAGHF